MISLGQLGSASWLLALALTLYAALAGIVGARRRDARLLTSARLAAVAVFLAVTAAMAVMEAALLADDFSVSYVAEHSRIASPLWVKVVTLWAALEGSLLLWAWLLAGYTALLATTAPNTALKPWALAVMQLVLVFFIGVSALAASPFEVLAAVPLDGPGPNALLQNHWMMAVHPVLLYLGFTGLTVPFAFAMAALITKRPGSDWMSQTRRWTLTGWGFLSAGIVAGGWWSYEVLGWGGFWAWDPVENVSFLPWLTATAFIHSVQVQERRRMLKAWNAFLVTLTFALSILGTFLIRSGILSSVHAFGDGPVGPVFPGVLPAGAGSRLRPHRAALGSDPRPRRGRFGGEPRGGLSGGQRAVPGDGLRGAAGHHLPTACRGRQRRQGHGGRALLRSGDGAAMVGPLRTDGYRAAPPLAAGRSAVGEPQPAVVGRRSGRRRGARLRLRHAPRLPAGDGGAGRLQT